MQRLSIVVTMILATLFAGCASTGDDAERSAKSLPTIVVSTTLSAGFSFEERVAQHEEIIRIQSLLNEMPGWAGARVESRADGSVETDTFRFTPAALDAARAQLDLVDIDSPIPMEILFEEAPIDPDDLRTLVMGLRAVISGEAASSTLPPTWEQFYRDEPRWRDAVAVGYSYSRSTVLVWVEPSTLDQTLTIGVIDGVPVEAEPYEPAPLD